jgi:hypothetical protein
MPLTTVASQGNCAVTEPQHHEQASTTPPPAYRRDGPTWGSAAASAQREAVGCNRCWAGQRPAHTVPQTPRSLRTGVSLAPRKLCPPRTLRFYDCVPQPATLEINAHCAIPRLRSPSPATVPWPATACPGRGTLKVLYFHDPALPCRSR